MGWYVLPTKLCVPVTQLELLGRVYFTERNGTGRTGSSIKCGTEV